MPQRGQAARAAAADPVLALQRMAGNRAVGTLIARDAKPKTPAKPPAKKAPEKLEDGIWATVPGVGVIKLNSAQMGTHRPMTNATGRGVNREASAPQISEITVTSDLGDHSNEIFRGALWGEGKDVEIRFVKDGKPYLTMKLKQALISSYSVSGHGGGVDSAPQESWTLNAVKVEYEADMGKPPPPPG